MKIILAGSNGFIGSEVLTHCLASPHITRIIALSRRALPASTTENNPKVTVTVVEDFTTYAPEVLEECRGAEACIWVLGKAHMPDNETNRKISIDYTLSAAKTFHKSLAGEHGKKFRFVYCSGSGAERDQMKTLWFMQDYRRIRGQAENELLAFAKEHIDTFETCILRPSMVRAKEVTPKSVVLGLNLIASVRVDVLAKVLVDVALNGSGDQIIEHETIVQLGS